MDFLVSAIGSYGDVHPYVGLGVRLKEQGHRVTIAASGQFAELVAGAGLDFFAAGTVEEYQEVILDADLWHPLRGPKTVMQWGISRLLRPVYEEIERRAFQGPITLVAHPIDFASRIAREKLGLPMISTYLAPVMFRSDYQAPVLTGMLSAPWVPAWVKRSQNWMADRWVLDRWLEPVNTFREELGLPRTRRFFDTWLHQADGLVAMFPEWYAPPQPDWPEILTCTSFPLWDESELSDVPDDVADFISGGSPPVVFSFGSAMAVGQKFFAAAAAACERLEWRGMLLTRHPEQLPSRLPDGVRHFSYVPFSYALPRASAFVHHGGIGSSSQGLAAGVPQLVMPLAHDQHDNLARLRRLGVASGLSPRRFRPPALAKALEQLVTSGSILAAARQCAERLSGERGLEMACDEVLRLSARLESRELQE